MAVIRPEVRPHEVNDVEQVEVPQSQKPPCRAAAAVKSRNQASKFSSRNKLWRTPGFCPGTVVAVLASLCVIISIATPWPAKKLQDPNQAFASIGQRIEFTRRDSEYAIYRCPSQKSCLAMECL
ncbi:uncharacterized protein M421DRAFT_420598 [Didymella exigua CBS 183.55]|uniref:Uncharacterized protein n=1 Tax=Didymella exigua CBS 183.55 TaxID=1150837 RepID=A0A6A5RMP5_9PLEO|nr:uncharacterized protein M421DRAFT_420598 [Didymella exigua CBS 183.55]KAF1928703.1 hypothetical protein M421DRAFT_420598 [Didymella exigua CBS 183.55]